MLSCRLFRVLLLWLGVWLALTPVQAKVAAVSCSPGDESSLSMVGEAYSPETGELVYTEKHYLFSSYPLRRVDYHDGSGRPFVTKLVDYNSSEFAPEFVQFDRRTGIVKSYILHGESIHLSRFEAGSLFEADPAAFDSFQEIFCSESLKKEFIEEASRGKHSVVARDQDERRVVDAGFDPYIRARFNQLLDGETIVLKFALPPRATPVAMTAARVDSNECESRLIQPRLDNQEPGLSEPPVCVKLRPKSWFMAQLLQPIYLVYGMDEQRLQVFYGLVNVASDERKGQTLMIRYRYL